VTLPELEALGNKKPGTRDRRKASFGEFVQKQKEERSGKVTQGNPKQPEEGNRIERWNTPSRVRNGVLSMLWDEEGPKKMLN